jgi:hypothetical protein
MTKKLATNADKFSINKILIDNGYFHGLNKVESEYEFPSKEVIGKIRAGLFDLIHAKIQETERELDKLQKNVSQMKRACQTGKSATAMQDDNLYRRTQGDLVVSLQPFDGWAMSLVESWISIMAAVHNPETAAIRTKGINESFVDLWYLRSKNQKAMQSHPELFNLSVFLP